MKWLHQFFAALVAGSMLGWTAPVFSQAEPQPTKAPPVERGAGELKDAAVAPAESKKEKVEPLSAEKAQELFESIYADPIKEAVRSSIKEDDKQLAAQMLESAKQSMEHPNLVVLLARGAYDLTAKLPIGYETALEATQMLSQVVEDEQQRDVATLGLDVLKKWYTSAKRDEREILGKLYIEQLMSVADLDREAEEMNTALRRYHDALSVASRIRYEDRDQIEEARKDLISQKKTYDQIALYKAKLKRNNKDHAAAEAMVMLYVVALDQPQQARKYTFLVQDKALAQNISLASLPSEKIEADDAYTLARWYSKLSSQNPNQLHLMEHAITAFERFVNASAGQPKNIKVTAANLKLKDLKSKYEKATEPKEATLPRGRAIDLVKYVHLKRHTLKGTWVKSGSRAGNVNTEGHSFLRIPVQPSGDYQFQVTLERKGQTGGPITVALPVKDRMVNFVIGDGYGSYYYSYLYGGLSQVRGYGVTTSSNPTQSGGAFLNNKRHNFIISVMMRGEDSARIHATYNGKKYFDWTGSIADLSPDERWTMPGPPSFGIGAYRATVAFHALRFKLVKGTAKVLKSSDLVDGGS